MGPSRAQEAEATGRLRLQLLMAARLGLSVCVFALALVMIGAGREDDFLAEAGLYGTLAAGFLSTAIYASLFSRVRRLRRYAALQLATDILIVTALVFFTGGSASIFGFLYLPLAVYGALMLSRGGAYVATCAASLCYMSSLLSAEFFGLRELFQPGPTNAPLVFPWAVMTAALLLVVLLSSVLAKEVEVAGEALHRSRKDLGDLQMLHEHTVESLTSGLVTTDALGRILSMNSEAERITGFSRVELLGEFLVEHLPVLDLEVSTSASEDPRNARRLRVSFRDRAGQDRFLGVARSALRDDAGQPEGAVFIFQDVTDIVAMEHDLRRHERLAAAGALAAHMAHEIRNPLAAISGSIQLLHGQHDAEESDRLIAIAGREIERLDVLLSNFLDYARPATGPFQAVAVGDVVSDVFDLFGADCPDSIELSKGGALDLEVWADRSQLHQVIWNLVLNAAAAMEEGGELRIAVSSRPQGSDSESRNDQEKAYSDVAITVSDTGVGIPTEALERVFDPFFTSRQGGSGLGLATVHRIVEGHHGSVHIKSSEGSGTAVTVRLPSALSGMEEGVAR